MKETLEHYERILYALSKMLEENTPRMNSFKPQIGIHFSFLSQISDRLSTKYREGFDNIYIRYRILNG